MNASTLHTLYEYNAWANHRVFEACAALSREQFTRDLGSSFHSVRDTLVHILGAEWLWLERWQGRSPRALLPPSDFPNLASVRARSAELERELSEFVAKLRAEDLERVIGYQNLQDVRFAYPLRHMLLHVVNHGSYHRGQVATLLRQLGARPLMTDYLAYFDDLAGQLEK